MFKHLLVPLDGSRLSEASLEAARFLAGKIGASITLLHVMELRPPTQVHGEPHLRSPEEAESYLESVRQEAFAGSTKVAAHVHIPPVSDVADSIVRHAAEELHADLVVTSTHGRGGAQRLLSGSIAQKVVAERKVPVLLVKPGSPPFKLEKLLVPLNPDSAHDISLPVALSLAMAVKAEVSLLSVVPTFTTLAGEQAAAGTLMPATTQAFLAMQAQNAAEDLRLHGAAMGARGIRAQSVVARGDPAVVIREFAEASGCDVIILSTHGKVGAKAFWARSVAPKVTEHSKAPVLLIPLPGTG